MPKEKVALSLEIESDHQEWLRGVVGAYGFPDESKALRVLLDFAIRDADDDMIFAERNMRCLHCGD